MYGGICIVGERGQITIPKIIREMGDIKFKDKLVVKMERKKITVEKALGQRQQEEMIKEFSLKYNQLNDEVSRDWEAADSDLGE